MIAKHTLRVFALSVAMVVAASAADAIAQCATCGVPAASYQPVAYQPVAYQAAYAPVTYRGIPAVHELVSRLLVRSRQPLHLGLSDDDVRCLLPGNVHCRLRDHRSITRRATPRRAALAVRAALAPRVTPRHAARAAHVPRVMLRLAARVHRVINARVARRAPAAQAALRR